MCVDTVIDPIREPSINGMCSVEKREIIDKPINELKMSQHKTKTITWRGIRKQTSLMTVKTAKTGLADEPITKYLNIG